MWIETYTFNSGAQLSGADPAFLNGGGANAQGSISTEHRVSMTEYLQVPVLSNCILTVTRPHNTKRHFQNYT